jgi:hypothetical protein
MKTGRILIVALALVFLATGAALAASATQNITINATVNSKAKLTFTTTTINFSDADPDTTPVITSTDVPTVTAKVRTSGTPTLTCLAGGDLTSGTDTIAISNVSWTASGDYQAGTMSKSAAVSVDNGWTGSGTKTGTLTYQLANSWDYKASATPYTATVTYTLTAP